MRNRHHSAAGGTALLIAAALGLGYAAATADGSHAAAETTHRVVSSTIPWKGSAMSNTEGLVLEPRVVARITEVQQYIRKMRQERAGWGPEPMREADATAASFVDGLAMLFAAERVWIDGGTGFSFGGVLPGGITFGMIARGKVSKDSPFTTPEVEWTFHS